MAYAVIGAMAVQSYVPYRPTRDLDVLIEPTLKNGGRARPAVARRTGARQPPNVRRRDAIPPYGAASGREGRIP